MKILEITKALEQIAPLSLQEEYDNCGLLLGDANTDCTGILCTLDVTENVVDEAIAKNCNLIVAHHPLIFRGMKRLIGATLPERTVIRSLKNDIAIYAAHTNFDNIIDGVNGKIADLLGLANRAILEPKKGLLKKLYTFVPTDSLDRVRDALFAAGAGNISKYSECSFSHEGTGTFRPGEGAQPYSGEVGIRKHEHEAKLEVILPSFLENNVLKALFDAHPYEEVAYDMVNLSNQHQSTGSGIVGEIPATDHRHFLQKLGVFNARMIRHTPELNRPIRKVAVCGGAGHFLIPRALQAGVDAYVTSDLKYHDFFLAEGRLILYDIGHFESEQFTAELFVEILEQKFPNFAVLKSEVKTNPVHYFTGK